MFSFHILCFKTEKEKILLLLLFFFKIEKKKPFRSENFAVLWLRSTKALVQIPLDGLYYSLTMSGTTFII